jgi:hypothetical protein
MKLISYLQAAANCPYPDTDQCSPNLPTHVLKIHFNIILASTPRSYECSLSLKFPYQNPYAPLLSSIRAKCPAYLIILDFITQIIFAEDYRS